VETYGKGGFISSGLYTYPILQAADILIYKADFVPVGKDQEQHLELTRNIAQRFNHQVNKDYFKLPEPLFTEVPKVMSTAEPTRKMSASLGDKHNIDIFADPDRMRKQVRSAVTDTGTTGSKTMSPGVENLFRLLKAAGTMDVYQNFLSDYQKGTLKYSSLKDSVADALIEMTNPIRHKKQEILKDKKRVKEQIRSATDEIRGQARQTILEVKELVGLLNVRF
jgi:tryptophanyl-tRNA synthetase